MKESIQNAVLGYVAQENQSEKLDVGTHTVRLTDFRVLHSRIKWDGSEKDSLPEFKDATPQLGVEFRDEKGQVAWHRFNVFGYKRWDELTDKQQGSDKFAKVVFGESIYACQVTKDGLVRMQDEKRTNDAASFIDQFMAIVDKTGETVGNACTSLVAEKDPLNITIELDEYDGKDQYKITKFAKAKVLVGDEFGE